MSNEMIRKIVRVIYLIVIGLILFEMFLAVLIGYERASLTIKIISVINIILVASQLGFEIYYTMRNNVKR